MANMSYCRFENTYRDLEDCARAIDQGISVSESEKLYRRRLIDLCEEILCNVGYSVDQPEDGEPIFYGEDEDDENENEEDEE